MKNFVTGKRTALINFLGKAGLALAVAFGLITSGLPAIRWADKHIGGGALKDAWGVVWWREDWASAVPIPPALDAQWMTLAKPWRIAHALGASGTAAENSLEAFDAARRDGMELFEVDVWLDGGSNLRCHHGPAEPGPMTQNDCTLDRLLPKVQAQQRWLILDIKTDFAKTGEAVVRLLQGTSSGRQVIFQLYRPDDLKWFSTWARETSLAEPIVTAYVSHRRPQYIQSLAAALNIKALAVPIDTLRDVAPTKESIALLTHPVHTCIEWQTGLAGKADGLYTLTGLRCPGTSVPPRP